MQSSSRNPTKFEEYLQRRRAAHAEADGTCLDDIADGKPLSHAPLCVGVPSPKVPKLPATLRASFSTLPFSRVDPAGMHPESPPAGGARGPRAHSTQHLATQHSAEFTEGEPPRLGSLQHMLYGNKTRELTGYPTKSKSMARAVNGGGASTATATAVDPLRASAPELTPQVLASLSSPPTRGGGAGKSRGDGKGGGGGGKGPQGEVYGELASAAASLASVAQKLARGSAAATDRKVAASYDALAAAAADLAASACLIKPLTAAPAGGQDKDQEASASSPSRQQQQQRQASGVGSGAGTVLPSLPSPSGSGGVSSPHLPRAVDPTSAAAGAAAAGSRAVLPPGGLPPSPSRPGTGAAVTAGAGAAAASPSRARVVAPRFPGYNPLIHFMTSDLPPPGTAASERGRPPTSSPITHTMEDARPLFSSAGSGTAGSRRSAYSPLRSLPGARGTPGSAAGGGGPPPVLTPADLARLPVLSLSAEGAAAAFSAGAAGGEVAGSQRLLLDASGGADGGGGGALVDPLSFLQPYADLRLADWPPPPITVGDLEQDELDTRYNKVLAALRERLHARGAGRLAAAFRDADPGGSGGLSAEEFGAVLRRLEPGGRGLVDDRVVSLFISALNPAAGAAAGAGGAAGVRVSYGDFVNALRYGSMPWRGYNAKLRHRVGGDPEQPLGAPSGPTPYGVNMPAAGKPGAGGAVGVLAAGGGGAMTADESLAAKWADLHSAFRALDHNGDGVVEWGEFREALRRVGERHHLGLSDDEVAEVFAEATAGAGAGAAAATPAGGAAVGVAGGGAAGVAKAGVGAGAGAVALKKTGGKLGNAAAVVAPGAADSGVNYEAFMALYGAAGIAAAAAHGSKADAAGAAKPGAAATAAAAAAQPPGAAPSAAVLGTGLLLPEFFQPKTLRCSHADRPWPQNWRAPSVAAGTARAGAAPAAAAEGAGAAAPATAGGATEAAAVAFAQPLSGAHADAAARLKRLSSSGR
ncbi:hypothetical protein HYH02_001358 [Chlamydomonas schloesseri]|uniref:EF-hand domain-containing protein n=1 Tax=Chlamydomonas schloesseri TaxID=2026947 RepID=A0A835WUP3_9CHLO|nr:hypothetical protein HYH02_001358 [Chlamydomonas schloesseri]|eukprot:KAG2454332.1 hypothetical protein HYH02_001358 [Chlamydomonas schloesseri]